ncbi:PREDICTED: uncharacterized protein LOC108378375 [Rhagoletis zephyria]|uniref:uncharacterized protein LOC108378375 n=1 Tax=Rhagoletis zephyria TaxID=28612 RepID=UPI0008119336|nr:PREDICTED: uncharacterized protein LOC108378375 [Rhagoletis zephyria]
MKCLALIFILVAALALCAHAKPEPEPAKVLRAVFPRSRSSGDVKDARNTNTADDKSKSDVVADSDANADANANEDATTPNKGSGASSGRLFLKKLTLFKNIFGSQEPAVIPIIIANSGTGTYTTPTYTSPTSTITTTGSIPTATGIISTSPTSGTGTGTGTSTSTASRGDTGQRQHEQPADEAAVAIDEEQLQAALAAGAQEYVVTDQEIRGTSDAKATKGPARVNLRRPGGKKGQFVTVRIPARYRQYFKNGQKVMLNTGNRPPKRRVIKRRRVNKNRRRKAGGKRRRVNNKS